MKSCVIYGDMSSDEVDDNYPTVTVCDACVEKDAKAGEDGVIVNLAPYDPRLGTECEFCGKTADKEAAEL